MQTRRHSFLLAVSLAIAASLLSTTVHGQGGPINPTNRPPFFDSPVKTISVPENFNTSSGNPVNDGVGDEIEAEDVEDDPIEYYIPTTGLGADTFTVETSNSSGAYRAILYFIPGVNLDREVESTLQVAVYARDGINHGVSDEFITVTVQLLDVNDNPPTFMDLPSSVNVPEDKDPGQVLFTVVADDPDSGKNAFIDFSITNVEPSGNFIITITGGSVILNMPLDYEMERQYVLTIVATDLGDPAQSAVAQVTIDVTDVNDNPPVFSLNMFITNILENATMGTSVITIVAEDGDQGIDDEIIFSFNSTVPEIDGVPSFAINSSTGEITVNSPSLNRENISSYSLIVKATEANDPTMTSEVTVEIIVLDVNDNGPRFAQGQYNTSTSELTGLGTNLLVISASDMDVGENAEFQFHFENLLSNDSLPFNISSNKIGETVQGTISLAGTLDYETTPRYQFLVIATETATAEQRTAFTTVEISVINNNDMNPVFEEMSYTANISEAAVENEFVLIVEAEDGDDGSYGIVRYSLLSSSSPFSINESTGIIRTTSSLNYETQPSYTLTVVARDSPAPGDPASTNSAQVTVQISVLDVNDNAPVIFVNGSDTVLSVGVTIGEMQDPGQLVYVVVATDEDSSPHNILTYNISSILPSSDPPRFAFSEDEPNQIVTTETLDYEQYESYTLNVVVSDGMFADALVVHVDLMDSNDNTPMFNETEYNFEIDENLPNDTLVGNVMASDNDRSALFSTVRYSISGVNSEDFYINDTTGDIFTSIPLDADGSKQLYTLTVTATDLDPESPRSGTATVVISVQDVNDNRPVFTPDLYVRNNIFENETVISIPLIASDADSGNNAVIDFSIIEGNHNMTFIIDSSGVIRRNPSVFLDREVNPEFDLTVQALDNGTPTRLNSTARVIIRLQDVNDNSPVFSSTFFNTSIPENVMEGTTVTRLTADDPDFGSNSEIQYTLISTTPVPFTVNPENGEITTTGTFEYDFGGQREFNFDIQARDDGNPSRSSTTTLEVAITDVNDNAPMFDKTTYTRTVPEDLSANSSIQQVTATDGDSGTNQELTYQIVDTTILPNSLLNDFDPSATNTTGLFYISSTDGVLYLSPGRNFDRESVTGYSVQIRATDGGTPTQSGTTTVHVSIQDINDNDPQFSENEYNFTMSESEGIGYMSTILVGAVTDIDDGANADFTFSLSDTSFFDIDSSTGVLSLIELVDYEIDRQLVFNVTATNLARAATVPITVIITDANDNSPQFPSTPYSVSVSVDEDNYTEIGQQFLTNLKANDSDSGEFGNVTYSIAGGSQLFWINTITGDLYVTGYLDRETTDSYTLTIIASDGGVPARTATATVDITVLDINESPPTFGASNYSANIAENSGTGVSLVKVSANDPDLGNNGTVTFSLMGINAGLLSIDNVSGVITTNSDFNYEVTQNFTVTVVAADNGDPIVMRSMVPMTVFVLDENDNNPMFTPSVYPPVSLPENMNIGQFVAQVSAMDLDSGQNGAITYTLANGQGRFSINPSNGTISLVSSLDRENEDLYQLVITATDNGQMRRSSSSSLNITVTDINDNEPVFNATLYQADVSEDRMVDYLVLTMFASDADIMDNSVIDFEIADGDLYDLFRIDRVSSGNGYLGRLLLAKRVDYENQTSFQLTVTASDRGVMKLTGSVQVIIDIINTNDNQPMFAMPSYVFAISENIVGAPVGTIVATDADSAPYGTIVSYTFAAGTDQSVTSNFTIGLTGSVGELRVIGMLDHEKQPVYTFSIVATDSNGSSNSVPVTVNVTNVNEGAPQFGQPFYTANVTENLANAVVTMVMATEMDSTQTITYSIVGDYTNLFSVDPTDGTISTIQPLNRENQPSYILSIRATDNGSPPLGSTAQVTVAVLDVNDNSPVFPPGVYSYPIPEDTETNTVVINDIAATDADIDNNAQITYSLSGGAGVFTINPMNGHITLVSSLNRESVSNYTLNVTATDMGTPMSRSASQLVTVIVTDSNDNPPVFLPASYSASIPENTDEGELVVRVSATDSDLGDNAVVTYSLAAIEGVPFAESPFTVTSDGDVLTNSFNLNWEDRNFYRFTVRASDDGSPPMTALAAVNVTVLDLNDNHPVFTAGPYTKVTPENNIDPNGNITKILLLRVEADDMDMPGPNSTVRYSITSGADGIFSINTNTGDLFADGLLDFEQEHSYTLTVTAMDSPDDVTKTLSSSTNVTILLTDVNDNKPVFQSNDHYTSTNHYAGSVLENATVGTTVLMVYALDDDTGANGEVTYAILGQGAMFSINATTGFIAVAGSLNTEDQPEVNLTVVARDGGNPTQLQNAIVTIKITGVNDNIPAFPSSFYTNTISEGVSIGTVIRDFNAIDLDTPDTLVYSILTDNNNFTINSTSGELIVDMPLDREFMEVISLQIQVSDGSNNATTTVQITLEDVNDNPPMFEETRYYTNITENTPAGAAVLVTNQMGEITRIEATDADKQGTPNNLVTYVFTGANSGVLNIDPSSAVMTVGLGANFDYETDETLDITVQAYDRNGLTGSLTSSVTLTIYVEDENDVAPSFNQSQYSVNLVENTPQGTSVATVLADDPDTGLGGVVNYFITGANPLLAFENFEISATNGTVYVTDSVDRETMEQVTLTITARDSSTPFLSSTSTLSITITDVNDNAPKFSSQHYFVSVFENLTAGGQVIQVSAEDIDTSNNAVIDYYLLNLNDEFALNQVNGKLVTTIPLDHETNSTYEARIQACDRGSPMRCSNATVVIDVADVNDETPIFDYDAFCVDVCSSETDNGTEFAQLVASDADSGDNGRVRYSISAADMDFFTINEDNGKISFANALPAGTTTYDITVQGTDSGNPPRSSSTTLQVNIRDCSSGLIFTDPLYTPAVKENTTVPAVITTMISVEGAAGPVTYSLLGSTVDLPFSISTDGVLSVTGTLDKEDKDMYSLNIQANDGVTTTCAIVTVTVLDVNDNPPQFLLAPYFFSIDENCPNKVVGSTLAIDPDQPGTGGISYRIQSQTSCPADSFLIGQTNGSIIAVKSLDRETDAQCVLIIEATDQDDTDPRQATAVVTITVNDVNDNSPDFEMDSYEKTVSESMPPDSIIVRVEADDEDQGDNAQITYSIISGSEDTFRIDPNSGTITTTATLDFDEGTKFYNLTVLARDNGSPSLNDTVPVLITIEDYNDCTPQFTEAVNNFQKDVFENAVVGTVIIDLNSTDCDSGQNSNVTYSIIGGNDGRFTLDPITGVLSIGMSLDFEDIATPTYNLDVRAQDNGSPSRSSIAQITVNVFDFNDHSPIFNPNFYMFSVSEAIEIGNNPVVGQVSANDSDSSLNGNIRFAITEGNIGSAFVIDENSGVIRVVNSLNREEIEHYSLFLTATDQGSPARSANATVNITILDANDNNPTITNINSTTVATVLEGALADTLVFTVEAFDPDEGPNAIIDFSLGTAGVQDVFLIVETDGSIFVRPNANIDFEETQSYTLTVVASDRGASPRMTSKELTIRVIDKNDNSPQFEETMYTGVLSENANNVKILTLTANDADGPGVNSEVQFSIITKDETRFEIINMNNNSGILVNTQPFDREVTSQVNLTIQASNAGANPPLNTTVDVTITILDVNDNAPSYTSQLYTKMIVENSAAPTEIFSLIADDDDQAMTPNSELTYSIIGTENIPFAFNDSSRGQLLLTRVLNREQRGFYSFDVEVEDQGSPRMSGTATIEVTVLDVNDNPPIFTVPNGYRITIDEGNLPSTPYLLAAADYNDPDIGSNRESVFSIVSVSNETRPLDDMTLVTVDNSTIGDVWLNRPLDYETTKNLTVFLAVNNTAPGDTDSCNGCTLWSETTVTVIVRDINDNPPMFTKSRFNGQVSTAVPTASRILQITANDLDSGNFGTVRYRLLAGSSTKFSLEETTGFVLTRGTFTDDDGQTYTLNVEAYDNLGASISLSSTATVELLVLKDFRRVLIIFDCPINEITLDREQVVVDVLQNVTGFQIVVEERREHVLDNGDVNPNKTDFIFHAIQRTTGEIVDFDTFISRGNEDQIFSALIRNLRTCTPERITSLDNFIPQPAWDTTMIIITIICILLSIGAIVLMIMACQQRYLALHDKRKQLLADVFYGAGSVSLAEGMPRDFSDMEMQMKSLNHQNEIYVEPYNTWTGLDGSGVPSTGDLSSVHQDNPLYEEQEIRMEMFNEGSDEETEGDVDEARLLAAALQDEDEEEDGSVTAI